MSVPQCQWVYIYTNPLDTQTMNNRIEFHHKVKNDGKIKILENKIIKDKPISHLTVDLQYDAKAKVFLDADKNVYFYENTIDEMYNFIQ